MIRCEKRVPGRIALGLLFFFLPFARPGTLPGQPGGQALSDESAIRQLIREIHALVPGLVLDGEGEDWEGIPSRSDSSVFGSEDPSLDIVSAAIVPTDTDLWISLTTAGRPSRRDRAFWVKLDLTGSRLPDLQIGLSPGGNHHVMLFDGYQEGRTFRTSSINAAVGDVVELRLPLDSLEAMLGEDVSLSGAGARSWVRVFPLTWDSDSGEFVDFGPAVGSFRIQTEPFALDPPLPEGEDPAAVLPLPVEGQWWVSQGAFSYSSHANSWAYDLTVVDKALRWASDPESCRLEDNFSWNRQVWSPAEGRILRIVTGERDGSPCRNGQGDPNFVFLDLGDGVGLWLAHFRQGSVVAERRDEVRAGQFLGRVGNSGVSSGPHLHLGLYDTGDGETTLPMAFQNVRVGLNPGENDPWSREMPIWEPREGFFVQAVGEVVPWRNIDIHNQVSYLR